MTGRLRRPSTYLYEYTGSGECFGVSRVPLVRRKSASFQDSLLCLRVLAVTMWLCSALAVLRRYWTTTVRQFPSASTLAPFHPCILFSLASYRVLVAAASASEGRMSRVLAPPRRGGGTEYWSNYGVCYCCDTTVLFPLSQCDGGQQECDWVLRTRTDAACAGHRFAWFCPCICQVTGSLTQNWLWKKQQPECTTMLLFAERLHKPLICIP